MTREKLKQKAEEGLKNRMGGICYLNKHNVYVPYTDGFLDGYNEGVRESYRLRNCINCMHLRISNNFSCVVNNVILNNLYGCAKWESLIY